MKKFCDIHWALLQIMDYRDRFHHPMMQGYLFRMTEGAFIGGRKTKAVPLIEMLGKLCLIERDERHQMVLTSRGIRLLACGYQGCYDLNEEQKTLLASCYIPVEKQLCTTWLGYFSDKQDGSCRAERSVIPRELQQWTEEMLYLNVAYQEGNWLCLHPAHYWLFADRSAPETPMTMDELMEQLLLQEQLGVEAEEIAEVYERSRLLDLGLLNESARVERISGRYVNAGYDLLSFSSASVVPNRYIEVKSVGSDLRFFWSINELETAKAMRDRYFLYLIERTRYEPAVWIVQDPFHTLACIQVKTEPIQFHIQFDDHAKDRFVPLQGSNLPSSILR